MRIASAQYAPTYLQSWDAYVEKITQWVTEATKDKATLLLFPEYASLELLSLFPDKLNHSYHEQFRSLNELLNQYIELYTQLAAEHNITIIPGTFPVADVLTNQPIFKNRAFMITKEGVIGFQDKNMMTRFETEDWIMTGGQDAHVITTPVGKIGLAICYDAEFPLFVRKLCQHGADIILVPSCTDTISGYNRVKIACQARALENQTLVIQSVLVGQAEWCDAIDINYGAAGFFVPPDRGLPEDGILALGECSKIRWVIADIDLQVFKAIQQDGQVLNVGDWYYSEMSRFQPNY